MRMDYSNAYNTLKPEIAHLKEVAHHILEELEKEEMANAGEAARKLTSGKPYCADHFVMENGCQVHQFLDAVDSLEDKLGSTLSHCRDLDMMAND